MTNKERVLDYLKHHKRGITPMEAWEKLGVYRLSDAIHVLRKKDGYNIITNVVEVKNKYGKTCSVARYVLIEE